MVSEDVGESFGVHKRLRESGHYSMYNGGAALYLHMRDLEGGNLLRDRTGVNGEMYV